tara:strand:+ start:154 stop:336 length:183 start_codon:yes stop_codon:yes gene_type:complete
MKFIFLFLIIFILNSCNASKETAINNVKYQKAKIECLWSGGGFEKNSDQFKKCIQEKMSE